jgi:hypothetical protein
MWFPRQPTGEVNEPVALKNGNRAGTEWAVRGLFMYRIAAPKRDCLALNIIID